MTINFGLIILSTLLIALCIFIFGKLLQQSFKSTLLQLDVQVQDTLTRTRNDLTARVEDFNIKTEQRLATITNQIENKLNHGFEKTNETFIDIVKRLTVIDEAQKKISELSTNVVSLQEILSDKRARGAFGEVQLHTLIKNVLPSNAYALQYTLKNGTRADCVLFLPNPSGNIVIDSKFPLEDYQKSNIPGINESSKKVAQKQFGLAVKKHINDISDKYIIPGETSDGAVMFIPAEAIFSEIHAYYPDLVSYSQQKKVWLTSPTTMMAVLTTAHSVLKDAATRQQVNLIQEHLRYLSQDFGRFEKRMDNLTKHLNQANQDAEQVHISAKRINSRFKKIEQVDIKDKDSNNPSSIESLIVSENNE